MSAAVMTAAGRVIRAAGPREDSPRPAPPPAQLPPREPVAPAKLRRTLKRVFGLAALRPGQSEVIARVLAGQNTLAVMPTGAGKSLCYQLPAVLGDTLTVVISPLIALMKDQCDGLVERGVAARQLHSALDANTRLQTEALLTRGAVRVLFTTPERLADARTLGLLQEQRVGLLVVDEAHCISQWGHDFRPAFSALRDARRALGRPPVLALTATASAPVQREIADALDIPRDGILSHGVYRPNLWLAVELPQTEKERRAFIQRRLQALHESPAGSAIVYCATVREAAALHRQLREADLPVGLYHGKLPARERVAAQEAFMRDETRLMIATNAFGMGIDKPDIRLVLHAQMPASIEAYVQECGRAGRDGERADCVLLFREGDRALQQFFAGGQTPSREELAAVWQALVSQTPQRGWLPAALADMVRMPQRRLGQALAALRSVRALRGSEATGLQPTRRREAGAIVDAAEAAAQQRQQSGRDGLDAMVLYAKAGNCRWAGVLAHFGETLEDGASRCGHCDSCARFERLLADERAAPAAVPDPSPAPRAAHAAFVAGQRVRVRRFGWGEVQLCSAEVVRIAFARHGVRDIHPDFVLAKARG